ncbi:MAG TPA: hypothetical protein VFJ82_05705 [Longimicrobium sp.]|nr:hypothetical protein [Longimicrobium sp.]
MSNIKRFPAEPSESKKKPTRRCSGEAEPATCACLIATALAVAALFGAAPATAQLRIDQKPGADVRLATAAAPDVRVRGEVLRVGGNGNVIVVWPIAAARVGGNDTTLIVWPKAAARVGGNGNVIIVWPRTAARVGDNDTTVGIWPSAAARVGGNGNTIIVWPIAAAGVDGNDTTVIVWPSASARVGGNGNTIIVWPIAAARVGGSGNTIVVWPRAAATGVEGSGTTVIVWARAAATGVETDYAVAKLASIEVRAERDRKRGTLIGAGIATAFAALFCATDRAHGEMSSGEVAGTVASSAVAGGLLGYAFAPRGWRRLPLPARP